jgi:glycosyltransferase involved in cell wall biosynthesis
VTAEAPDRNLGGGNRRQAHLLRALTAVAEVDLFVCGPVADPRTRRGVSRVVELPASTLPIATDRWRRRLDSAVHVFSSRLPVEMEVMAPAVTRLREALAGAPAYDVVCAVHMGLAPLLDRGLAPHWILDLPHLPSRVAAQTAEVMTRRRDHWILNSDERKARHAEARAKERFDLVTVCSAEDAAVLGGAGVAVVPNGVDLAVFSMSPIPAQRRVLLAASLNYLPNVDGAEWFCNDVWPRVLARFPDAALDIVGRAPIARVIALGERPGVRVIGDVPDMAPFLRDARVAVVPVRIGSGTRIKALEAMAAGRPVVGTSLGLEGLGVVDGEHAYIADDPARMAERVSAFLAHEGAATATAARARHLVEERFSWDAIGADFAQRVVSVTRAFAER